MTPEYIEVTGARENNLRNVSVRVPERAITAFVGVSGSGKSSLVLDTIAAEAHLRRPGRGLRRLGDRPGPGRRRRDVVFTGTPADLCALGEGAGSHTGAHLARHVHA